MKDINELVEIIADLGGRAPFDLIIKAYQKSHHMVVFPEHRSIILQTLNSHPSLVQFDGDLKVWFTSGTKIPTLSGTLVPRQGILANYITSQLPNNLAWERKGELLRAEFVKDYPIASIESLTLDDYLIAKNGYGNSRSFCRRLRTELQTLSSMGNAWPATFELYYKNGTELDMSLSYKKVFGDSIQNAFSFLKKEIVRLLNAAKDNDYHTVEGCKINSSFKAKLISVYFPEQYAPVCVKDALYEYCSRVGVSYSKDQDMVYGMSALSHWKNSREETRDWSNAIVMSFCDWMWNNKLTITSNGTSTEKTITLPTVSIVENYTAVQSEVSIQPNEPENKKGIVTTGDIKVGTIVKSKKYGEGKVELIENAKDNKKYLTINFDGENKKFVLPDAFSQGFLSV